MLRFFNIKNIEKQINYGARHIKYYWLNNPHRFEYREILKVTPYCNFNFINFPFDFHECRLVFGSDALSTTYGFELSKPFITYKGKQQSYMLCNANLLFDKLKLKAISFKNYFVNP